MATIAARAIAKGRRVLASSFRRRELKIETPVPLVSFTFDDAPRSAFDVGGVILGNYDARATYFVSLGLLGSYTEIGELGGREQVERAVEIGHELGCHTFGHLDAWHTSAGDYLASVDANRSALTQLLPGHTFRAFAYPKSGATLSVKAQLERRFDCCRGGGQSINVGTVDLNLLTACFLDPRARVEMNFIRQLIDRNADLKGWLIFVAHDISDRDGAFSCGIKFFDAVVRYSAESGADLLTVGDACVRLRATRP